MLNYKEKIKLAKMIKEDNSLWPESFNRNKSSDQQWIIKSITDKKGFNRFKSYKSAIRLSFIKGSSFLTNLPILGDIHTIVFLLEKVVIDTKDQYKPKKLKLFQKKGFDYYCIEEGNSSKLNKILTKVSKKRTLIEESKKTGTTEAVPVKSMYKLTNKPEDPFKSKSPKIIIRKRKPIKLTNESL